MTLLEQAFARVYDRLRKRSLRSSWSRGPGYDVSQRYYDKGYKDALSMLASELEGHELLNGIH